MAKLSIVGGATSQSVNVFVQNSSSTVGAGLTGLVFNSSSLTAYYTFTGANCTATAITLATLAAVNSAYSSGGFKEIDATNMPGLYRLDIPNAALAAASGQSVTIMLKGATNMAPVVLDIELTGWNNQDAVHGGLSALPNTACTTNASIITSGTGTDQLQVASGNASADAKKWLGGTIPAVNVTGVPLVDLKYTLGTISPATAGSVRADAVTGAVGSLTTNNDKTGYAIAAGGIGNGAHAAAELNNIADAGLDRIISVGTDSGADDATHRTVRQCFRILRNKVSIAAGTATISKEDDATASWTAAVTTAAGNPISAIDPT